MAKILVGYISAYIKKPGQKNQYPRIGTMFRDDDGRFSFKLDSIPVENAWEGWCNVFPPKYKLNTEKENADEFAAPPEGPEGPDVPF